MRSMREGTLNFAALREYLGFLEATEILEHIAAGDLPHPTNGFAASDAKAHWHRAAVEMALLRLTKLRRPNCPAMPDWAQDDSSSRA
jgi:hypothetical protein